MECSTFLTPFADPDQVIADPIVLYSSDSTLSTYGKWLLARMDMEDLRVATRGSVVIEHQRTRMLWHVRSEGLSRPEGRYEIDLEPDRVREFVVPAGEVPPCSQIAREVAEYAAVMSFQVGVAEYAAVMSFQVGVHADDRVPEEEPF